MEVDRNGLEVLSRAECLRLLASATLGRIGFTSGALPAVLPVAFRLADQRILVHAGRSGQLHAAIHDAVVAFEVDDYDRISHMGWSVSVTGVATEVEDPAGLDVADLGSITRWAPPGGDEVVLAISTELVSGRRTAASSRPVRH